MALRPVRLPAAAGPLIQPPGPVADFSAICLCHWLHWAGHGLAIFVVPNGLDWAATAAPTARLAADIFGKRNVGTVFAWISVSHQIGAAAIAFSAGALRTWLGDYHASFVAAGFLGLLAAGMVLQIRPEARADSLPVPVADTGHIDDAVASTGATSARTKVRG